MRQLARLGLLISVFLLGCNTPAQTGSTPPPALPAREDEAAVAGARAERTEVSGEAHRHYAAALDYLGAGEPGFALEEIDQALAAAPDWPDARLLQGTIDAAARTELRNQQRAVEEAARTDAAKAAENERAQQQAARATAQARYDPTVVGYARTAPRGTWAHAAGGIGVAVGYFEYRSEVGRLHRAPVGKRFIVLSMLIDNQSAEPLAVDPREVTLVDQQGETYQRHSTTLSWCTRPLEAIDVRPGKQTQGCLVFLTDANTGPARVRYGAESDRPPVVVDLERPPDSTS